MGLLRSLRCPKCGSGHPHWRGIAYSGGESQTTVHYQCHKCGHSRAHTKRSRKLRRMAHDLCACECARELTHGKRNNARALGLLGDPLDLFREWLGKGDTEAAIKALWEACEGTNES